MSVLPEHPDLDQARRQAKELLHAAQGGDARALAAARGCLGTVDACRGATGARARTRSAELGGVGARDRGAQRLDPGATSCGFCASASTCRSARPPGCCMRTRRWPSPGFPAAVVLGDAARVEAELRRDPGAATRVDPGSGWTALHLACASRFHLDPARAPGLAEVARLLLDAGADDRRARARAALLAAARMCRHERQLESSTTSRSSGCCWTAARRCGQRRWSRRCTPPTARGAWNCSKAAAGAARSCSPRHWSRRSPMGRTGRGERPAGRRGRPGRARAGRPLRAPTRTERRRRGRPSSCSEAAATIRSTGCSRRSSWATATARAAWSTPIPGSWTGSDAGDLAALVAAAERGNVSAVELMLETRIPDRRSPRRTTTTERPHCTPPRGPAAPRPSRCCSTTAADLSARDTRWHSQPLDWALVGSGEAPDSAPAPDWVATVTLLLDAGASLDEITLDPDEPKPPSAAVLELLRSRGSG